MRRSASRFKRSNPKLLVNMVYTEFLSPSLPPSSILLNKLYFGTIVDLLIHQSCREFVYLLLRYKYFLNTFDASGTFWACGIQQQNCAASCWKITEIVRQSGPLIVLTLLTPNVWVFHVKKF